MNDLDQDKSLRHYHMIELESTIRREPWHEKLA